MKVLITLLALGFMINCSTTTTDKWDSGAQRQEAIQEERRDQRGERTGTQFPDATRVFY